MSILVTGGAGFIGANFVLDGVAGSDESAISLDKLTCAIVTGAVYDDPPIGIDRNYLQAPLLYGKDQRGNPLQKTEVFA